MHGVTTNTYLYTPVNQHSIYPINLENLPIPFPAPTFSLPAPYLLLLFSLPMERRWKGRNTDKAGKNM